MQAVNKTGGPSMPDFLAFAGSTNNLCPLLDLNPAADFDLSPQDGIIDASVATLIGRIPRPIPGKPGYFICAIAPAGGFVQVRRSGAVQGGGVSALSYAYTAQAPISYLLCDSGGFLYKLGAINVPGDASTDSCVMCLRGSFSTSGASMCRPCQVGHYQDKLGQKSCPPCQYGYAGYQGAQRCMDCFYGRAYCSEGFTPNEHAFACNQARLPAGYSPEGGFSIVRPYIDPTNIDHARRYSKMFNSCTINTADTTMGLNISAECRVDVYVLGDLGINNNVCSANSALNSVSAFYTGEHW
jgi:hypothetical protein